MIYWLILASNQTSRWLYVFEKEPAQSLPILPVFSIMKLEKVGKIVKNENIMEVEILSEVEYLFSIILSV